MTHEIQTCGIGAWTLECSITNHKIGSSFHSRYVHYFRSRNDSRTIYNRHWRRTNVMQITFKQFTWHDNKAEYSLQKYSLFSFFMPKYIFLIWVNFFFLFSSTNVIKKIFKIWMIFFYVCVDKCIVAICRVQI